MFPYVSLQEMILIHSMMGVAICVFAVIRSSQRNKVRKLFDFGSGMLGQQALWIKWYSWALGFELITSFLGYEHTQMLYYEIALSFFEAAAVVTGAFIVDRLSDLFTGNFDVNIPTPNLDNIKGSVLDVKEHVQSKIKEAQDYVTRGEEKANQEYKEKIQKEKSDFNSIIKGH